MTSLITQDHFLGLLVFTQDVFSRVTLNKYSHKDDPKKIRQDPTVEQLDLCPWDACVPHFDGG